MVISTRVLKTIVMIKSLKIIGVDFIINPDVSNLDVITLPKKDLKDVLLTRWNYGVIQMVVINLLTVSTINVLFISV
jgi:hypothetical protein